MTFHLNSRAAPAVPAMPAGAETQKIDLSSRSGVGWEFRPEGGAWKPIAVPGGVWRAQGETCDAGTYRTTLRIPTAAQGKAVRVVFAALNFGAVVPAGPDAEHLKQVAAHIAGWVPVTADLSFLAQPGKPLLLQVDVKGGKKFRVNGKYTVYWNFALIQKRRTWR